MKRKKNSYEMNHSASSETFELEAESSSEASEDDPITTRHFGLLKNAFNAQLPPNIIQDLCDRFEANAKEVTQFKNIAWIMLNNHLKRSGDAVLAVLAGNATLANVQAALRPLADMCATKTQTRELGMDMLRCGHQILSSKCLR